MTKPFRLGISGSSFIYVMPRELLANAIIAPQRGRGERFDDAQNRMMVDFMREMMDAINTGGIESMECYHSMSWDRDMVIQVVADDPKIELWSVHGPYGRYLDPSSPEPECREGALCALSDAVGVARKLGAKLVVVHPGADVPYGAPRQERLQNVVETLRPIADLAGESGIRLAVEPLPKSEIGSSLDEVLSVVDQLARPNVGVNFDVNHLFPPEDMPRLIRETGELLFSVHVSDQDGQERHWLPFEGTLDWAAVLQALTDIGYTGPLVYEAHVKNAENCADVVRIVSENYSRLMGVAKVG